MNASTRTLLCIAGSATVVGLCILGRALAHCDTMQGPVVSDARAALDKADVTPVLKWVSKEKEAEVREAFNKSLAVRAGGVDAKDLADRYFFETLVRIHRAGEGAPYSGIKPVGAKIDPIIEKSDKALDAGSADELVKQVTAHVEKGIRDRFNEVSEARKHAGESVDAGRKYVAAYVEYMHYVEGIHAAVAGAASQHQDGVAASGERHQH